MSDAPYPWGHVISKLLARQDLTEAEAAGAMTEIMEGAASDAQIAGFVIALRAKGESTDEIVGLVRTMRSFAEHVDVDGEVLDTCGTGGDRTGTFNVSTAAAFVCAGAGVKVAKHGNRAASSRCGSADVLEALGVKIDVGADAVARCIAEAGIGFCFAPMFHPAMRHAGAARRDLATATVFNFLGPLTNPAGATRQALGVSDERMLPKMVETLGRLGSVRVLGFHGHDGLDELSTAGPSRVVELADGATREWTIDPAALGLPPATIADIAGGDAEANAATIRAIFEGESGPRRDIVALNAAAGLVAAGRAGEIEAALRLAQETIDSGRALRSLDALVAVSNG